MKINFNKEGQFFISTEQEFVPPIFGYCNSAIALDGDYEAQLKDNMIMPTADFLVYKTKEQNKDGFTVYYEVENKSCSLVISCENDKHSNFIRQVSTFKNAGDTRVLTQLACTQVLGVCYDENGIKERLYDGSIEIYYCLNRWQAEGQWRKVLPEDVGVITASGHVWEKNVFRIESLSSWSTDEYYPILFIVDKKKNECFFIEKENGESWFLEVFCAGGTDAKFLTVKVGGADERLGLSKAIKSGQSYTTSPCVYGVVKGGINQAVRELTKYKRKYNINNIAPTLVFNDFMNCNWALPTREKLIPLIDKASEIGVETFCIDDGWAEQGVWKPLDELFGEQGFVGIIDYIISKGMKPGVWFEFERASDTVEKELNAPDYFMKRYGQYLASDRKKVNLNCKKAREYLIDRISELYSIGIRYIKNDHNNCEGIGFDGYDCFADSVSSQAQAFISFVEEVRRKFPDLIIENCGGGGMRSDFGTLKHFSIQSVSDQENYMLNPSITGGSLAYILPEKAGLWCYPCPLEFNYMKEICVPTYVVDSVSSERQTAVNIINGMIGSMYLSGKIHQLPEKSLLLVKEGVQVYKQYRDFIKSGYAVFPHGFIRISNRTEYSIGIVSEDCKKMMLAVWNLSNESRKTTINLDEYHFTECKEVFYANNKAIQFSNAKLEVDFGYGKDAILLELNEI